MLVHHERETLVLDGDDNRDPEGVLVPEPFPVLDTLWTPPERDIPVVDTRVVQQ